jgi:hypothetical protein
MLRFFGALFIIALLVAGWGYARGWFSVTKTETGESTHITFALDKDQAKRDVQAAQAEFDDGMRKVDVKLAELKQRARAAASDRKAALDASVKDLERDRADVARKIDEFKTATHERMKDLMTDIRSALDRLRGAIDHALAS